MIREEILLNQIQKIQEFNQIASLCDYDVDLQQGKYTVDGKSIMGIFSLNVESKIVLILYTNDEWEVEKFKKYFYKERK